METKHRMHRGIKFKVYPIDGVTDDANGRKLYKISIEDWGPYNERAYNEDLAVEAAKRAIDSEID
jgi:hypothetical protein